MRTRNARDHFQNKNQHNTNKARRILWTRNESNWTLRRLTHTRTFKNEMKHMTTTFQIAWMNYETRCVRRRIGFFYVVEPKTPYWHHRTEFFSISSSPALVFFVVINHLKEHFLFSNRLRHFRRNQHAVKTFSKKKVQKANGKKRTAVSLRND
jgi:hypothetical protein